MDFVEFAPLCSVRVGVFTALTLHSVSAFTFLSLCTSVSPALRCVADCVGELVGVWVRRLAWMCARTLAGKPACVNSALLAHIERRLRVCVGAVHTQVFKSTYV